MGTQLNLLEEIDYAEFLRDKGMKQATDHADQVHENWSDKAYAFLLNFAKTNKRFLVEEVREKSLNYIPFPPSERAWGSIIIKAKNNNIVKAIGFKQVSNPKAHKTPATYWEALI